MSCLFCTNAVEVYVGSGDLANSFPVCGRCARQLIWARALLSAGAWGVVSPAVVPERTREWWLKEMARLRPAAAIDPLAAVAAVEDMLSAPREVGGEDGGKADDLGADSK